MSGDDPASPEDQRQRIEALCEREGITLPDTLLEHDVSGGAELEARPGLSRAMRGIPLGGPGVNTDPARLGQAGEVEDRVELD